MESLVRVLLEKYRLQVGVFLVVAVLVGGGVLALWSARPNPPEIHEIEEATAGAVPANAQQKIKVDVAGAVVNPGVYELFEEARVEDALNAAGGLAGDADRGWVDKNLNLATKLADGDKLYLPKVGETSAAPGASAPVLTPPAAVGVVSGTDAPTSCSRVNINTTSAGTLDECLSGIGPAYAQSIIDYRESHGGFKTIEEIQEVRGIGPKTFEKIKDQITVD